MSENTDNMKRNLYVILGCFDEIAANKDKGQKKSEKQKVKEWIFGKQDKGVVKTRSARPTTLIDTLKFLELDLSVEDSEGSADNFCAKLSDALEKINVKRSKKVSDEDG